MLHQQDDDLSISQASVNDWQRHLDQSCPAYLTEENSFLLAVRRRDAQRLFDHPRSRARLESDSIIRIDSNRQRSKDNQYRFSRGNCAREREMNIKESFSLDVCRASRIGRLHAIDNDDVD